jgi:pimeloyl-ACP methyl ester carboxylesterase
VPTAILHGNSDRLVDPAAAEELHQLIAGSTLKIYPDMGHSLPRELWTDIITEIHDNATRSS